MGNTLILKGVQLMGNYIEIYIKTELKSDTPQQVIDICNYLFNDIKLPDNFELPSHNLFECDRWEHIGSSCSFYHTPFSMSKMEQHQGTWYINSRSDLKSYNSEVYKFFEWIKPYTFGHPKCFIGYILRNDDADDIELELIYSD